MSGTLLLATRSAGKLRELRRIFAGTGRRVLDLGDAGISEDAAEDDLERFDTFEENALAKARHFHAVSGLPTVADDSGLEVRALGGRPGVRSKRWSGRRDLSGRALDDANNAMLLAALEHQDDRSARFVCVAAFVDAEQTVLRRGECSGRMLLSPRGEGGFGYDPYFESSELARTLAEVDVEEKARVSHRGRAFRALLDALGGAG